MGIEPTSQAWEARILPMNYTRKLQRQPRPHGYYNKGQLEMQPLFVDFLFTVLQMYKNLCCKL